MTLKDLQDALPAGACVSARRPPGARFWLLTVTTGGRDRETFEGYTLAAAMRKAYRRYRPH